MEFSLSLVFFTFIYIQWRSWGCRHPEARYLDCAPGEICDIFPSVKKKIASSISKFLFLSHHPIFLDQSTQHTGFALLFTQLTNEAPHFVLPFTNCTTKMAIFSPSLRNIIYPNFRE